jgi:hypothetical protein
MNESTPQPATKPVSRRERLARVLLVAGIITVVFQFQSATGHQVSLDIGLVGLEHRMEATAHSAPRVLTSEDLRHLQITLYDSAGDSVVHASFAFDADLDPPPYVNTGTTVLFAGTYRVQSHLRFEDAFRTISTERMTEVTVDRDGAYPLRL